MEHRIVWGSRAKDLNTKKITGVVYNAWVEDHEHVPRVFFRFASTVGDQGCVSVCLRGGGASRHRARVTASDGHAHRTLSPPSVTGRPIMCYEKKSLSTKSLHHVRALSAKTGHILALSDRTCVPLFPRKKNKNNLKTSRGRSWRWRLTTRRTSF